MEELVGRPDLSIELRGASRIGEDFARVAGFWLSIVESVSNRLVGVSISIL